MTLLQNFKQNSTENYHFFLIFHLVIKQFLFNEIQYDVSKDDLDWRKDFKYLNFICFMKNLRSRLIKDCSIA